MARTGDDLQEPARLGEPFGEHGGLGASEAGLSFTQDIEYFYSMHQRHRSGG
jgi:hypothetical protein